MIKTLTLSLLLAASFTTFSQKIDLDKFKFNFRYQVLPQENIPAEKRTFTTSSTVGQPFKAYTDEKAANQKINLTGWKRVESEGTVNINLDLIDFRLLQSNLKEDVTENKDKAGKVTSRSVQYYINADYNHQGRIKISGPFSPKELSVKEKEALKVKEEKVASNRFLAKTSIAVVPKEELSFKVEDLYTSQQYTSSKETSSRLAVDNFNTSQPTITSEKMRNYADYGIARATDVANYYFGFPTSGNTSDHLWIIDTKSHPEYQTQQEAIQAVKALFATMEPNKPLTELEENIQPLIEYFESLKTKYKADEKAEKKIRYGAFYNLSKIYYYLDRPALAIIQAEGLIANDYDPKDGQKLKEEAQELQELFNKTKFTTRHNTAN